MNVKQFVKRKLAGETEVLEEKPSPMPLCPPQIPHDLIWARTRAAAGGKPAGNHLSYSTAILFI
jgi:hypothetical protein